MILSKKHQAAVDALKWELCWTPLEMACVGIGLWMTLLLQWITLGTFWLVAFLAIDFVIRFRHYALVAPRIHGPQTHS